MHSLHHVVAALAALMVTMLSRAEAPPMPTTASPAVTTYPAAYFASSEASSAFDMLALLPGYRFVEGDTKLRGLASASGNVLIDGSRPAGKHESIEALLRRMPAASVVCIDVIRAGTPGVDMQGHAVVANVVRARNAQLRGSVELGDAFYERDFDAPRVAGEIAHRAATRLIEMSASVERAIGDEHGAGGRTRVSPQATLVRDAEYSQDEIERIAAAALAYENNVLDGKLRLRGSLQQTRSDDKAVEEITFPTADIARTEERERETSTELGAFFERAIGERTRLELSAVERSLRERSTEASMEAEDAAVFRTDSDAEESIVRALARRTHGRFSLEGGLELALNRLENRSALSVNGAGAPIPNAKLGVEEIRSEVFAAMAFRANAEWRVDLGTRFEYSEISQRGDSTLSRSFFFPKPRLMLAWSRDANRVHVLVERIVGQLDLEDFASSASLSTGTLTAGNPNLEPDRTWRAEIEWERRILENGSVMIAARRDTIHAIVDRIPIVADTTFDAIGNIGNGVRNELEFDITWPLDQVGIAEGVLKITAIARRSKATDPVTGSTRPISEEAPLEASLQFTQPMPRWRARWGVVVDAPTRTREYRFDEVRTERIGTTLDVFVECEPARSWTVRLFANNLLDHSLERRREVYEGIRSDTPLRYLERRELTSGPYVGATIRRLFGN